MPDEENSYTVQNFPVQLVPGQNILYLVAENPNGMKDVTADQYITWNVNSNLGIDLLINACEDNSCSPYSDGAYVEIYNNGILLSSFDVYDNEIQITNVLPNNEYIINITPYDSEYAPTTVDIEVNNTSITKEVNLSEVNNTIEIPDYYISGIDINTSEIMVNEPFTATANVVVSDPDFNISNLTYDWYYMTEDNNIIYTDCHSFSCEFNFTRDGSYLLGVKVGDQEYTMPIYVNSISSEIEMPPMPPEVEENESLLPPTPPQY